MYKKYTINGIPTCSFIASFDQDGVNTKYLKVRAVDSVSGNEFGVDFFATPNLFNHFLPVVDQMINSFRLSS